MKGSREEGAKRTGAATAPVVLVPTESAAARPLEGAIGGKDVRVSIEHIELVFVNPLGSLYPCGFRPFLGVIYTSQVGDVYLTGR